MLQKLSNNLRLISFYHLIFYVNQIMEYTMYKQIK